MLISIGFWSPFLLEDKLLFQGMCGINVLGWEDEMLKDLVIK